MGLFFRDDLENHVLTGGDLRFQPGRSLFVGAGAAAPVDSTDQSTAGDAGPPSDLPGPVPDFVENVLHTIGQFVDGVLEGALGPAVSDDAGQSTSGSSTDAERCSRMRTKVFAFGTVLVIATAAVAFAMGVGPAPGGDSADIESFPTEESESTGGGTGAAADTEEVGDMESGESYTTRRVEISLVDARTVRQHDGWITVQTTVQSDSETMTVTERRQLG